MTRRATTWILAVLVLLALVVDVATRPRPQAPLPTLSAFDPASVDTVVIARRDEVLTLVRRGEWRLGDRPLDPVAVRGLVDPLVAPDVVGRAVAEVDGWDAVRVTLKRGDAVVRDVLLGADGPTGLTLLRQAGSDEVLQVQMGGRERYDAPVSRWVASPPP